MERRTTAMRLRYALPPTVTIVGVLVVVYATDFGLVKSIVAGLVAGVLVFGMFYLLESNPAADDPDD